MRSKVLFISTHDVTFRFHLIENYAGRVILRGIKELNICTDQNNFFVHVDAIITYKSECSSNAA